MLQDIYNILSKIAVDVQPPENVAINTTDNIHTIQNFGYNLNPKHYGSYEYAISLKVDVDYNIENLVKTVLTVHFGNILPKLIREVDKNQEIENLKAQIKNEQHALQIDIDNLNQACLDLNQENDGLRNNLQAKEQECEELKQWKKDAENLFKTQTDNADKIINRYKLALESIEHICRNVLDDDYIRNLAFALSDIINKAKE